MRGQGLVFYQCHNLRTTYHAMTDWLQYRINIVTRTLVDFQQKTNLSLNDQLDPKLFLMFSAYTRYAKWCLFYVVSYFCAGNKFNKENPMESNKYRISDINRTIIVTININNTYLLKWCTTIQNGYPVPLLKEYIK